MSYDIVRANSDLRHLRTLVGCDKDIFYNDLTYKAEVTWKCLSCKEGQTIKVHLHELHAYRWLETRSFTGVTDEEFAFLHNGICHKCFSSIIRKVDDGKQN